jgi:mRNA interferase RelE/StbE
MAYTVEIRPAARRQIKKLPFSVQKRVVARLVELGNNPHPTDAKKLRGSMELARVRVGDYRIIYQVCDDVLIVVIVKVGHRRDVYRS